MSYKLIVVILAVVICTVSCVNPYFHQRYEQILSTNQCLKSCMDTVTAYGEELSLLKNTQLKDYFNTHEIKCNVIKTAKECVDKCNVNSNPFELQVMIAHCSNETYEKINEIKQCFDFNGDKINNYCISNCGNYIEIKKEINHLTQLMNVNNNQQLTYEILEKSNTACGIYKCTTKCNIDQTRQLCNDDDANILQSLIQNIINAQRSDMERLNVVKIMEKTTPPQCDYMYNPQSLFGEISSSESSEGNDAEDEIVEHEDDNKLEDELAEAQMNLVHKQLTIIDKQERVLEKENGKLDLEIALLKQKAQIMRQRQFY